MSRYVVFLGSAEVIECDDDYSITEDDYTAVFDTKSEAVKFMRQEQKELKQMNNL